MQEFIIQDRFVLVDGHAIIYRAYHAFRELTDPKGNPVNAVYGFTRILLKAIQDFDPKYIAVTFDHKKGKAKRVAEYKDYKAQRPPMPEDLIQQVAKIKEIVAALNIPQFELEGYEADDILGTIARIQEEAQKDVPVEDRVLTTIITGDKDMLQLVVDDFTHVFTPATGRFSKEREYDEDEVVDKLGVTAQQVPDLKALMGDPSDNIPGVKGIGVKTATKLIQEFADIDGVYKEVENDQKHDVIKGSVLKKLVADKDMAYLSKELATISKDAPIEFSLEDCVTKDYNKHKVTELFEELSFHSLMKLLPKDDFEEAIQEALF